MSYVCQICGKKNVVGRSQKHKRGVAGKRWKARAQETPRLFRANLQKVTVRLGEKDSQMRLCAKCIKRIKKYKSIGDYSSINII